MALFWTIVTIALIVLEASTAQLICIWFCGGSFIALLAALFGAEIWLQITFFVVFSAVLLISTKSLVKSLKSKTPVKTNIDALIDEKAITLSPVSTQDSNGSVKVNGKVWSARSADGDIGEGESVIIKQIEGVKLIVVKDKN
jgi:membrane protein implicated in regulation of membrane protease activity